MEVFLCPLADTCKSGPLAEIGDPFGTRNTLAFYSYRIKEFRDCRFLGAGSGAGLKPVSA